MTLKRPATAVFALALVTTLSAPAGPATAVEPSFDGSLPYAVTTGGVEPYGLAASADGEHLYVSNLGSPALQVIDTATATVVNSVPLASGGSGVAVDSDGRVWVSQRDADRISLIPDPLSDSPEVHDMSLPVSSRPEAIALSRDGAEIYVAEPGLKQVQSVSTSNGDVLGTTPSDAFTVGPAGIVVAADGSVWTGGGGITAFSADLVEELELHDMRDDDFAGWPTLSPEGYEVYFGRSSSIDKIDVVDRTRVGTMQAADSGVGPDGDTTVLGAHIRHLALTPDGQTLYAAGDDYQWRARVEIGRALVGDHSAYSLLRGPVANGADTAEVGNWQWSNQMLVVGDALWTASDGTNFDGTIVQRDPIAPRISALTVGKVYVRDSAAIYGSGLASAKVYLDGTAVALTDSSFSKLTFVLPAYRTAHTVKVTLTTSSSGTTPVNAGSLNYGLRGLTKSRPSIVGKLKVGSTVKVSRHTWTSGTGFTYQWYANGKRISKATKSSYKISSKYVGKRLTVAVTGKKTGYITAKVASKSSAKISRR